MDVSCSLDTITAIATPPGNSGVGIVRISGSRALFIAQKFGAADLIPRRASLVRIKFDGIIDNAVVIYFKAPNSFTGEDIVELQCHGGTILLDKVVNRAVSCGARMAAPGEFTRRALLHGKLTLDQAEALINVIHAESDTELSAASNFFTGEFAAKMKEIEQSLVEISAQTEAVIDHPEELGDSPFIKTGAAKAIKNLITKISHFTDSITAANYIYNGINVAILGKPNVGKSSLFNALLGNSRSIVTEIPGTTTDTVSETIQIDGYKIRFIDTAGIRESSNKIEKLGIERSLQAAKDCDIALVFDSTALELVKGKPHITVSRNSDIKNVKKQIISMTVGSNIQNKNIINARQQNELLLAKQSLENALTSLGTATVDCTASDIQTALYHIGNITGTNASEAVLDEIFSRFCLGK